MPGCDVRGGRVNVGLKSSPRDGRGCGVGNPELLRMDEVGETKPLGTFALSAPTDPYIDFASGLDGTTHLNHERRNEPLVATGPKYPSVSETLRHLESAMGQPTGAETDMDITPMNIDTTLSATAPQHLPSGEGGAQCSGLPSRSTSSLLPFHLSTSKFPSSLSSPTKAPVEARPQAPRISATLPSSGSVAGPTEPVPASINLDLAEVREKVFAGPSLFLDDDGME